MNQLGSSPQPHRPNADVLADVDAPIGSVLATATAVASGSARQNPADVRALFDRFEADTNSAERYMVIQLSRIIAENPIAPERAVPILAGALDRKTAIGSRMAFDGPLLKSVADAVAAYTEQSSPCVQNLTALISRWSERTEQYPDENNKHETLVALYNAVLAADPVFRLDAEFMRRRDVSVRAIRRADIGNAKLIDLLGLNQTDE